MPRVHSLAKSTIALTLLLLAAVLPHARANCPTRSNTGFYQICVDAALDCACLGGGVYPGGAGCNDNGQEGGTCCQIPFTTENSYFNACALANGYCQDACVGYGSSVIDSRCPTDVGGDMCCSTPDPTCCAPPPEAATNACLVAVEVVNEECVYGTDPTVLDACAALSVCNGMTLPLYAPQDVNGVCECVLVETQPCGGTLNCPTSNDLGVLRTCVDATYDCGCLNPQGGLNPVRSNCNNNGQQNGKCCEFPTDLPGDRTNTCVLNFSGFCLSTCGDPGDLIVGSAGACPGGEECCSQPANTLECCAPSVSACENNNLIDQLCQPSPKLEFIAACEALSGCDGNGVRVLYAPQDVNGICECVPVESEDCAADANICGTGTCEGVGSAAVCVPPLTNAQDPECCNDHDACTQDVVLDNVCFHLPFGFLNCLGPSCSGNVLTSYVGQDVGGVCECVETIVDCAGDDTECRTGVCQTGSFPLGTVTECILTQDEPEALCCDDGDACTDDYVDPATGLCVNVDPTPDACGSGLSQCVGELIARVERQSIAPGLCECVPVILQDCSTLNSLPCEINACTLTPLGARVCTVVQDGNCGDGDPCTTDTCDALADVCINEPVSCDDGNVCTNEVCNPATGGCSFSPVDCNDSNVCTLDSCDPVSGCAHAPLDCDDGLPCTLDSCDPVSGCVHEPVGCDDGDACTVDSCTASGCVHEPVDCDDGDVCTVDSCSAGVCVHVPESCDDGDACTYDECTGIGGGGNDGICNHEQLTCDNPGPCNTVVCNPAAPDFANACAPVPVADGSVCESDTDLCTTEECQAGACVVAGTTVCTGGSQCTTPEVCNPATGACESSNVPDGTTCDTDANQCTVESCHTGVCIGGGAVFCDDINPCTVDSCDAATGACVYEPYDCMNDPTILANQCVVTASCIGFDVSTRTACTSGTSCTGPRCVVDEVIDCTSTTTSCYGEACNPNNGQCEGQFDIVCQDPDVCDKSTNGCTDPLQQITTTVVTDSSVNLFYTTEDTAMAVTIEDLEECAPIFANPITQTPETLLMYVCDDGSYRDRTGWEILSIDVVQGEYPVVDSPSTVLPRAIVFTDLSKRQSGSVPGIYTTTYGILANVGVAPPGFVRVITNATYVRTFLRPYGTLCAAAGGACVPNGTCAAAGPFEPASEDDCDAAAGYVCCGEQHCPRSQGYWRHHLDACVDPDPSSGYVRTLCGLSVEEIFDMVPQGGNAWVIAAHQYEALVCNIENAGAVLPSELNYLPGELEAILQDTCTEMKARKPKHALRDTAIELASRAEEVNTGAYSGDSCVEYSAQFSTQVDESEGSYLREATADIGYADQWNDAFFEETPNARVPGQKLNVVGMAVLGGIGTLIVFVAAVLVVVVVKRRRAHADYTKMKSDDSFLHELPTDTDTYHDVDNHDEVELQEIPINDDDDTTV